MINYQKASLKDINEITELLTKFEGDRKDISANQFILAKNGDRLIGCIRIKELDKDCLELASLVVMPEYRKQGIGSQLVKTILSKEGRRPIYLLCSAQQQGFYEQNGFELIDTGVLPTILKNEYLRIIKLPYAQNIKVIAMNYR
ncbi:MAG: GNAT family N-acetyltransferase [Armatimonadetes bacterium]|nr:GNAT family N-acetyltransferase [Armatimonadota bacterium]